MTLDIYRLRRAKSFPNQSNWQSASINMLTGFYQVIDKQIEELIDRLAGIKQRRLFVIKQSTVNYCSVQLPITLCKLLCNR